MISDRGGGGGAIFNSRVLGYLLILLLLTSKVIYISIFPCASTYGHELDL